MALPAKTGTCSICRKKGSTDWHHIISQHHAKKTGRNDLLDNPNNVVELCRSCHNQTTASMVRKRLTKEKGPLPSTKKKAPKKKVVDSEARKKAIRLKKRKKESFAALTRRGATGKYGHKGNGLQNRINKLYVGTKVESLYPPDHWLHDPKKYDEAKCKRFEREGWRWDKRGGASHSFSHSPNHRPPPSKGSIIR